MSRNSLPLNALKRVAQKEISLFFASIVAWLFLATFSAVTLFIFFWGEAFYARNISDVRPLFEWMPVLLIFLCSTLSMRMWSEERRTGTLEHVLTQPTPTWAFVVGKFVACLLLLLIALAITIPLPITVSLIGTLDWGPVIAGYLATTLLGSVYLAIGLFVSSRTQNQIVSLILSVTLCGIFYIIGSPIITGLFGQEIGEWLRLLGTGSRFESITRGVFDIGDLYYYLSLVGVFLVLNVLALERERWPQNIRVRSHRRWINVTAFLLLNIVAANLWIGQLDGLRLDTTKGQQYTLSDATQNYLSQLREPLLLRGYFSAQTHPLLAPLVPQLRDLLREYEVVSDGRVRVEFVDPRDNPSIEEEANRQYGIEPMPFQLQDRYQSSIVSSYFNVLVQYGDSTEVLGFRDLIDVKSGGVSDIDVKLRNPEYDLTKSIRKVLTEFQSAGNVFDTIKGDVEFTAYVSPDEQLPTDLQTFKKSVLTVVEDMSTQSSSRLSVISVDPAADGGRVADQIEQEYGFRPMTTDLFSNDEFYFQLVLSNNDRAVQLPLDDLTESSFVNNLNSGLQRFASGFTKRIALVTPISPPVNSQFGGRGGEYRQLQEYLRSDVEIFPEDLSDGQISGDADLLLVLAPDALDEKAVFAIDQYLMQGGSVIIATSPYTASWSRTSLDLNERDSGLTSWLAHNGYVIEKSLVLDPQNAAFPVPVMRSVGGMQVQDIRMLDYPFFVDIRSSGMNSSSAITSTLEQLTMSWVSPLTLDSEKMAEREVTELIHSSSKSWLSNSTEIMPSMENGGISVWQPDGDTSVNILAASSRGRFDSFFVGKQSPLLPSTNASDEDKEASNMPQDATDNSGESIKDEADASDSLSLNTIIERSPESAQITVFASNDFLRDQVIQMSSASSGNAYLAPYQLIANTIDEALDESGLLGIRSRGQFNRTLPPMSSNKQRLWEYLNYLLAALAIGFVAWIQRARRQHREEVQLGWVKS